MRPLLPRTVTWFFIVVSFFFFFLFALFETHSLSLFFPEGSLSDTALGLRNVDNGNSRRNKVSSTASDRGGVKQSSDRNPTGMGKKSNSTSQLSATGQLFFLFLYRSFFILILWLKSIGKAVQIEKKSCSCENVFCPKCLLPW